MPSTRALPRAGLLTIVTWCGLAAFASAQTAPNPFTIFGIVRLPDGTVAPRVIVKITSQTGWSGQVLTDDMGRYEIRDLPRGRYQLSAANPGDPDQVTDPADAEAGRAFSSRIMVHLYLRYRSDATTETGGKVAPVVSLAEATQTIPREARKAFEQALKLRAEHRSDRALERFNRAVELFPAYFQALSERGHLHIALGRPDEAAGDFARALQYNPRYEPALRGSGLCKFGQGRYAEAIEDLEKAAAEDPRNATTWLFMGVAGTALDRRDTARSALLRALELEPKGSARAHVHLARVYLKENRIEQAIAELEAYLQAAPDAPDLENLRALAAELRARRKKN